MASETDKIFSEFKEHSVAEFFKKNRQMLGFSGKVRSLTTIVHEYVTNSLDACEEAGMLPDITVEIKELDKEKYWVRCSDNGPGIPQKHLGKALGMMLAGTKFHRYVQQRGQQGIGASGNTMFSQVTTGKPVKFESYYDKKKVAGELAVDFKQNRPVITNETVEETDGSRHGLVVEGEFAEVKYDRSSFSVFEYIKRTALVNPHAMIALVEPTGERLTFPRSIETIPPRPRQIRPHPLGIGTNDLMEFARAERESRKTSSFLQATFSRMSAAKTDELAQMCPEVDFEKSPKNLTWDDCEKITKAIHSDQVKWIAPETDAIVPIGQPQIEKSLQSILAPQFMAVTERKPKIYRGGVPFVVEAALAWGGNAGKKAVSGYNSDIMRFANRAPLLFDAGGCAITEAVKSVEWKRYGIKDFENEQITVLVNMSSVHVPYTGAGKQAIATEDEIMDEVKNAVMEAARDLQRYLHGVTRDRVRVERKKAIMRYVTQLAADLAELSGGKIKAEELEKKLLHLIENKYSNAIEEDDSGDGNIEEEISSQEEEVNE
jgi:DNA topoisomerase-6 subunit B